jgi:hypothetical protein
MSALNANKTFAHEKYGNKSIKTLADSMKNVLKRNQIEYLNRRILKKNEFAKIKLFSGICKSDKFTLEQAYEDFAHIPLTTKSMDI